MQSPRVGRYWAADLNWAEGFPGGASGKESTCQCRRPERLGFDPWVGKIPWRRAWQPTPVFLPGEPSWTEEPGGLQSMGLQRAGHNWSDLALTQPSGQERVRGKHHMGWRNSVTPNHPDVQLTKEERRGETLFWAGIPQSDPRTSLKGVVEGRFLTSLPQRSWGQGRVC